MVTNDIRIDRLENGVRLLDEGQRKILDRIDELSVRLDKISARQDEMSARLDKQGAALSRLTDLVVKVLNELEDFRAELRSPKSGGMGFIKD